MKRYMWLVAFVLGACNLVPQGAPEGVTTIEPTAGHAYDFVLKWGTKGDGNGQFQLPHGVAVDGSGNVYVADQSNNRIQKFNSSGDFITKWGTEGSDDGQFQIPRGVAVDGSGNVFVADSNNNRIQKFAPAKDKDPQTITFGELAGKTYGGAPFTVTATASSGLPVAFASDTPGVCTVSTTSEGGTVTLVAAGTCTVTASQAGNDDYGAAAPVSRSFAVAKANQTVSFTSAAPDGATVGGSYPVEVGVSSGLPVALSAGPEAVCTLDESTVTFVGAGECTVRANQAGNANYNAAPEVTQTLSVVRATTPSILTAVSGSGTYGDSATLRATLQANGDAIKGKTVSFTLNGTPVGDDVTDDDGNATLTGVDLTGVDVGTQTGAVTASFAGDDGIGGSSESGDLTVAKADQTPAFAEGIPTTAERGSSATLEVSSATATPITLSSAGSACTVSGLEVSFVEVGNCTLTAVQAETANYNFGTATHTVEVVQTLTDTTLTNVSGSGTYGDSATLRATLQANGDVIKGKTVSFTLNGTPVGDDTTDANGDATLALDLTGVNAGTYTDAVSASFAGDDEDALAASEALGTLNVTKADQTLSFSSEPPTNARVGGSYTVSADATSGLPVFYRSATPAVCTVLASTVNFVGAGECVVAANQPGNGNYNAAPEITQRTTVAASTDGTALSVSGAGTYGGAGTLTATLTTGGTPLSGKSVAFTLSGNAVGSATTNGSGVATLSGVGLGGVDAGSYADAVGASFAGDGTFDPTLGSGTLNVNKAAQSVSFTSTPPSSAEVGGSYTVAATATSALPVSFSSDSSACTVSSETVTFTSAGSCTVRATQAGNTNYEAAFATQNVTVQEPAPPTATSDLYTVTFDGLTPGRIISNVALNQGIVSATGDRTDKVYVYARRRNRSGNVAMVTGSDRELLISKDGRSQTSYTRGGYIGFLFRNFGAVDVNTLEVSGVTKGGGNVSLFRGSRRVRSFAIPKTGASGSATISIDAEDIGLVVVTLGGPGRVDDLSFEANR